MISRRAFLLGSAAAITAPALPALAEGLAPLIPDGRLPDGQFFIFEQGEADVLNGVRLIRGPSYRVLMEAWLDDDPILLIDQPEPVRNGVYFVNSAPVEEAVEC